MTTYISVIGGGLGDVIVALPVINALIARGRTILVMRTPRQVGFEKLIKGLAGVVREADIETSAFDENERYINLRGHRLQTDYFWGGPEFERDYPNFRIDDIQNEMCKDFGIDADFANLIPFEFTKRPELSQSIIFIPGTTVDTKTWSAQNWLKLKSQVEEQGSSVFMLGQPEYTEIVRELKESYVQLLPTEKLEDAVDILSSARAVVSVDTGLMHLAVQQGTPTVCLYQDPIFHRTHKNATALLSKHCASICVENRMRARPQKSVEYPEWKRLTCEFEACLVPESERCINSITVEDVMRCLTEQTILI